VCVCVCVCVCVHHVHVCMCTRVRTHLLSVYMCVCSTQRSPVCPEVETLLLSSIVDTLLRLGGKEGT